MRGNLVSSLVSSRCGGVLPVHEGLDCARIVQERLGRGRGKHPDRGGGAAIAVPTVDRRLRRRRGHRGGGTDGEDAAVVVDAGLQDF